MKVLIVEDDFLSRKLMLAYLTPLGECDVASNGSEALEAFVMAANEGKVYDLITLDIMMPELNGQEALKRIRMVEEERGLRAARIIMTTALKDSCSVMNAFTNQCDGYLAKPIDRDKMMDLLRELGLVS